MGSQVIRRSGEVGCRADGSSVQVISALQQLSLKILVGTTLRSTSAGYRTVECLVRAVWLARSGDDKKGGAVMIEMKFNADFDMSKWLTQVKDRKLRNVLASAGDRGPPGQHTSQAGKTAASWQYRLNKPSGS